MDTPAVTPVRSASSSEQVRLQLIVKRDFNPAR